MRMTRSTVLEVLREDYVRTARAKGLRETLVVVRHALRNALLPVITVVSLEFAFLIGGLVVTEQVFNLNGIGKLLVDAVAHRDYTLVQALVLLLAAVFVFVNFIVDMVYVRARSADPLLVSGQPHDLSTDASEELARAALPRVDRVGDASVRFWRDFVRQRPLGRRRRRAHHHHAVFAAAFADVVAPYDPTAIDFADLLLPPSPDHLLGTDNFGRDVFSRIIFGSRTALLVGFTASLVGCTLGLVLGVDRRVLRGPHRSDHPAAHGRAPLLPAHRHRHRGGRGARHGRGQDPQRHRGDHRADHPARRPGGALERAERSCRCRTSRRRARSGRERSRIMFRHVAPNVFAPYLIMLTAFLGQAILLEASLSFLGLGVFEPDAVLGTHAARRGACSSSSGAVARDRARASRSAWRCSASTCSATRCATRSIRACARASEVLRARDVIRLHMGHFIAPGHLPFAGAAVVVDAFLVRHPSGPVLLDTGIGVGMAEVETMYKPVRRPLDEVLRDAGVSVGEIRAVANCHMHFDHSGNNFRFPRVPILAQRVEREAVATPNYTLAGPVAEFDGARVRATRGRGRHRARRADRADARPRAGSSVVRDRHAGGSDRHRRPGVSGRRDVRA